MSPSPMVPSAGSSKRRLKRGKRKRGADKSDDDTVTKKPCGTEEVLHEAAAVSTLFVSFYLTLNTQTELFDFLSSPAKLALAAETAKCKVLTRI